MPQSATYSENVCWRFSLKLWWWQICLTKYNLTCSSNSHIFFSLTSSKYSRRFSYVTKSTPGFKSTSSPLHNTWMQNLKWYEWFTDMKWSAVTITFQLTFYLFKVNSRNTRKMYEISSKSTIKTSERRQWRRSGVFIVNFEHISYFFQVLLLLTLIK